MNPPKTNSEPAFLLFAHGSSDPAWAEPFLRIKAAVQARNPGRQVQLAFLERMQPSFESVVSALQAQGIRHIVVAPIFLGFGGHMRKDLPKLIDAARAQTGIVFQVLPAMGEADALIAAIADWVTVSAS